MKKITFLLLFLMINLVTAQNWTTGTVALDTDYTVQFDVNAGTNIVTMTLIGPDNVWLGVAPGVSTGSAMGNLGDDAIIYSSLGLQDRNMPAGTGTPNLDSSQDWNVSSNTTNSGQRTLIATRAINTGDSNDYVFPTTVQAIPILWALGSSSTLAYHASRGGVVANLTLGADDFQLAANDVIVYPNPGTIEMNIKVPNRAISDLNISVFDVLGKRVFSERVSSLLTTVNTSNWKSGVFFVRLTSNDNTFSLTKRYLKY